MANDHNPPGELRQPPGNHGYEPKDASAMWLFLMIGLVLLVVAASQFVLHGVLHNMRNSPPPADQWSGSRRVAGLVAGSGAWPRLQISPPEDLQRFRSNEDLEMNSYGWMDRTAGVVRIPVARAVDLILQQGLPVRSSPNSIRTGPTVLELQQQRTNAVQPETQIPR